MGKGKSEKNWESKEKSLKEKSKRGGKELYKEEGRKENEGKH